MFRHVLIALALIAAIGGGAIAYNAATATPAAACTGGLC